MLSPRLRSRSRASRPGPSALFRARLRFEELEPRTLLSASTLTAVGFDGTLVPNDYNPTQLYGLAKISAPQAWASTTGSSAVTVAVIDTGIDYTHPDLYQNIWINQKEIPTQNRATINGFLGRGLDTPITFQDLNSAAVNAHWGESFTITDVNHDGVISGTDLLAPWNATNGTGGWADGVDQDPFTITISGTPKTFSYIDDLIGWDFYDNDNNPMDGYGHGSHVSGTIGAVGNNGTGVVGVNWNVSLMALKVGSDDGQLNVYAAIDAIYYSAYNGARVSNNSWIVTGGTVGDPLYNAIAYADTKGQVFVAAAGNNGFNNDKSPFRSFPASYDLPNIISVTATDSQDRLPSWANSGAKSVDLGAPGVNILSTVPQSVSASGYALASGTSMATPHVVGTAALILAQAESLGQTLTAEQVKAKILNGTDPIRALSGKTVTGGRLDAAAALSASTGGSNSTAGSGGKGGKNGAFASLVSADPSNPSTEDPQVPPGPGQTDSNSNGQQTPQVIVLIVVTPFPSLALARNLAVALARSSPVAAGVPAVPIDVTSSSSVRQNSSQGGTGMRDSSGIPRAYLSYTDMPLQENEKQEKPPEKDGKDVKNGKEKPEKPQPKPPAKETPHKEMPPAKEAPPSEEMPALDQEATTTYFLNESGIDRTPVSPEGQPELETGPDRPGDPVRAALALSLVMGVVWGCPSRNTSRRSPGQRLSASSPEPASR
jgi:subtilisin family serine protease